MNTSPYFIFESIEMSEPTTLNANSTQEHLDLI